MNWRNGGKTVWRCPYLRQGGCSLTVTHTHTCPPQRCAATPAPVHLPSEPAKNVTSRSASLTAASKQHHSPRKHTCVFKRRKTAKRLRAHMGPVTVCTSSGGRGGGGKEEQIPRVQQTNVCTRPRKTQRGAGDTCAAAERGQRAASRSPVTGRQDATWIMSAIPSRWPGSMWLAARAQTLVTSAERAQPGR